MAERIRGRSADIRSRVIDGHTYVFIWDDEGTSCGRPTYSKYVGGCRCDGCRDAWRDYRRATGGTQRRRYEKKKR